MPVVMMERMYQQQKMNSDVILIRKYLHLLSSISIYLAYVRCAATYNEIDSVRIQARAISGIQQIAAMRQARDGMVNDL